MKKEKVPSPSAAMDRRTRRYKQAILGAETSQRQQDGKKPFYLTLDREGKPYGPGRLAWLLEIRNLATGLDPSCTHIRKQSYEKVCIFKDRLNEKFDYSEDLNEDYLIALMGKAVSRRRTELITNIRRGGKQPSHMDEPVWRRLEKLASSEQRQTRTEHARYANGCRRTLGRTGSLGVHGVREKLRELYGRSPDPDEVLEEMERHKGYMDDDQEGHPNLKRRSNQIEDERVDEAANHIRSPSIGFIGGSISGKEDDIPERVHGCLIEVLFSFVTD